MQLQQEKINVIGTLTLIREAFAEYCVSREGKVKGTDPYIFIEKFDDFVNKETLDITR